MNTLPDGRRCFEDLAVGERFDLGPRRMDEAEVVEFARAFDPQPMHLDRAAGAASPLGGLAASGWHSCAVLMRLAFDAWISGVRCLGSPGVPRTEWTAPVLAGDEVAGSGEVVGLRAPRSRSDIGLVHLRLALRNVARSEACRADWWIIVERAGRETPAERGDVRRKPPESHPVPNPDSAGRMDERHFYLDRCPLGETAYFGAATIDAASIKRFARRYDPQPFHIDERAAAASLFKGLSASGWHSCGIWMRTMLDAWGRALAELPPRERERALRSAGVSLGFEDLSWPRPVRPGDTLHAFMTGMDKRESSSRPGWGLVRCRSEMTNGDGELVLRFFPTLLMRRGAE